MTSFDLSAIDTPALVLDEARMRANIRRLAEKLAPLDVVPRPHLKTAKSVEVARQLLAGGNGPATVSTLREAEYFAAAGVRDILYAVGIAPGKLARVKALRDAGCDLAIVLDSAEQARAVADAAAHMRDTFPTLIEIDCDGHRSGLRPDDPRLVEVGRILHDGGVELRGVMTHAGDSYGAVGDEALAAFAEQERMAVVNAARMLRDAGLPCPVVSVGSSPTAHFARNLDGVTEVRAGVYVFFDLVMAGIGVCELDDIAISVLATVIGHQRDKGRVIVDAGWMALSRDRGTASQRVDQGYGVVCDEAGSPLPDLLVTGANQEHGIVELRPGSGAPLPELPVGTRLRILPNHACATAAQFDEYHVLSADRPGEVLRWERMRGW
ncbi:DSD1 family PLP-dependent enzyme [Luteimonas soli]|uniref:DSD1 family PLP-dependent enzyme n=1 Tax=Luteimonas soli TaxID=1648966 RepID=A0ABV7XLB4_9GAMM